jgi:hypothetical protein
MDVHVARAIIMLCVLMLKSGCRSHIQMNINIIYFRKYMLDFTIVLLKPGT